MLRAIFSLPSNGLLLFEDGSDVPYRSLDLSSAPGQVFSPVLRDPFPVPGRLRA